MAMQTNAMAMQLHQKKCKLMQPNAMAMQLHQKKCKLMQPKPYLIVFL